MKNSVTVKINFQTYLKLRKLKKRFRKAKSISDVIERLLEEYGEEHSL